MKYLIYLIPYILLNSCMVNDSEKRDSETINLLMNQWHEDAANSNLEAYIGLMDENAIYIGTDASEIWTTSDFYAFCKPYFDKNTTWNFTTLKRDVNIDSQGHTAWFNEVLNTQMGICRGSGTLLKKGDEWKLQQYVLSVAIPNDDMNKVVEIKHVNDSIYLSKLK